MLELTQCCVFSVSQRPTNQMFDFSNRIWLEKKMLSPVTRAMPASYCEPAIVAASLKCKVGTLVWYCCTSSWATTLDIDVLNICCLQICTSQSMLMDQPLSWISIPTSRPSLVVWGKVCVCVCVCVCVLNYTNPLFSPLWLSAGLTRYLWKLAHLYGIDLLLGHLHDSN